MRRPWAIPWDLLVTQNTAIVSRLPPPAPTRSVRRASGFVQTPVTETGTGDSSVAGGACRPPPPDPRPAPAGHAGSHGGACLSQHGRPRFGFPALGSAPALHDRAGGYPSS